MIKLAKVIKTYFEKKGQEVSEVTLEKLTNSIKISSKEVVEGDIFFAIGRGNDYIEEALRKGALLVIGERDNFDGAKDFCRVEDALKAIQELASLYRDSLELKVIGITGTNGKTTTKDILYSLLRDSYKTGATKGNYNNHLGLPLTILGFPEDTEVAVLEMGMSNLGEIDFLCQIAKPDYGIITNIGESHLENLRTLENVYKAKTELLKYVKPEKAFLYGDDKYLQNAKGIKLGTTETANHRIKEIKERDDKVEFKLDGVNYEIPLNGAFNAVNAALALLVAHDLGISRGKLQKTLLKLEISKMRFEKKLLDGTLYINDAYNADPLSMVSSLLTLDGIYKKWDKIIVLGDMLELGSGSADYHRELLKTITKVDYSDVLLYGKEIEHLYRAAKDNGLKFFYTNEFDKLQNKLEEILKTKNNNKLVFLKGSRGMGLERLIPKEPKEK